MVGRDGRLAPHERPLDLLGAADCRARGGGRRARPPNGKGCRPRTVRARARSRCVPNSTASTGRRSSSAWISSQEAHAPRAAASAGSRRSGCRAARRSARRSRPAAAAGPACAAGSSSRSDPGERRRTALMSGTAATGSWRITSKLHLDARERAQLGEQPAPGSSPAAAGSRARRVTSSGITLIFSPPRTIVALRRCCAAAGRTGAPRSPSASSSRSVSAGRSSPRSGSRERGRQLAGDRLDHHARDRRDVHRQALAVDRARAAGRASPSPRRATGIEPWPARPRSVATRPADLLLGDHDRVERAARDLHPEAAELADRVAHARRTARGARARGTRRRASLPGLLVGHQAQDHVARRAPPGGLRAHERGEHHRHAALHVERAATPDEAVVLLAAEGRVPPRARAPRRRRRAPAAAAAARCPRPARRAIRFGRSGSARDDLAPRSRAPRAGPRIHSMHARSLPGGLVVSKRSSRASSSAGRSCSGAPCVRPGSCSSPAVSPIGLVLAALFARANSW